MRLIRTTMAEKSSNRKIAASAFSTKKACAVKSVRRKGCGAKQQVHSAPSRTSKPGDDFLAKEEHYKHLNAQIEAKTAELERQTELLMKEQHDILLKPLSTVQLTDFDDEDGEKKLALHGDRSGQTPRVMGKTKEKTYLQTSPTEKLLKEKKIPETSSANMDLLEETAGSFLANTIQNIAERSEENERAETALPEDVLPGVSDAYARVMKAKLRIMQEELDQLTSEYYKKDDENIRLNAKIKELEEERTRLQKAKGILQTQLEKHKALAEESVKKCEGLQLHVGGLNKEIENLTRSNKQAAALHNTAEIRLNRAVEESQRLKSEINKMKLINKDKAAEEHESKETLLAENKSLKKQKAELIVAFKKQLKLIDILKRQKMHFEAAKLLSFTEEEFVKALDWGGSV